MSTVHHPGGVLARILGGARTTTGNDRFEVRPSGSDNQSPSTSATAISAGRVSRLGGFAGDDDHAFDLTAIDAGGVPVDEGEQRLDIDLRPPVRGVKITGLW